MMNANRKKKRVLAGTMAALMVATSSPTGAFTYQDLSIVKAETVATEGYYTEDGFYIEDGVLRWYRGEEENIVIPNDVVSIGSGAFLDDEIKSVTIPESVTRIEEYAFYKTSLEEITIPDTVEYLGEYAFSRCEKLSKAELNTKTIEQNAFANCTKLTQVTFGDNVETIDREAFKNCEKLEILTLGKGIKNIGICCFQSCISLKEVSFPTGIDTIGSFSFEGCTGIEKIVFEGAVKNIDSSAFKRLTSLTKIEFSDEMGRLGMFAFEGCTALETLDLVSAKTMDLYVFYNCTALKEVNIHKDVKQIGESCFGHCENIETINFEPGIELIGESAFWGLEKLKEVSFPSTLAVIQNDAFRTCKNLEKVELPRTLEYVGSSSFSSTAWMDAKEEAATEAGEPFVIENNILFQTTYKFEGNTNKQIPKEITVLGHTNGAEEGFEIPEHITAISDAAFCMTNLKSIEIPDSVTMIGSYAFLGSEKLEELKLPSYIQSIPHSMCSESGIKEIEIPENVKSIGEYAFEKCESLTSVTLNDNLENIGRFAFARCASLKSIEIPAGVKYIASDAFEEHPEDFVIKGYTNSVAETFAKENGITFESIGTIDPEATLAPEATQEPVARPTAPVVIPEETEDTDNSEATNEPEITPEVTQEPEVTEDVVSPGAVSTKEPAYSDNQDAENSENTESEDIITDEVEKEIIAKGFVVELDPTGGIVENPYVTVINGRQYEYLPTASRNGYIFTGWYTEKDGGVKIENTTSVNLTSDQVLYAHWSAETCKIEFDGNGGSVDTSEKTATFGDVFGELPTATKSDATFLGWYTDKENGILITQDMLAEFTGDTKLYARWETKYVSLSEKSLSYSFGNGNADFSYASDYRIPLSVYQYTFGNTNYAKELYENNTNWFGNCYGMSSTSIFFNQEEDGVSLADYGEGKELPSQLQVGDMSSKNQLSLKKFIEVMQVSQFDPSVTETIFANADNYEGLSNMVTASQEGKGQPVIICIYGPEGGHAIVGYKVEDNKLYVYDPNFPENENRYISLQTDNSGKITGWYYCMNDCYDWGSDYNNSWISYVPYEVFLNVWEKKGRECYYDTNLVWISTENASIYNVNNEVVATVKNGELVTNDPRITQLKKTQVDESTKNETGCNIFLPTEQYTIENEDTNKEFTVEVIGTKSQAEASTSNHKVTVNFNDLESTNTISVATKQGTKYQLSLSSLSEKDNVVVSGTATGEENISVTNEEGGIQFENCEAAEIKVNGNLAKTVEITAKSGQNGTISRVGTKQVASGKNITYAMKPDVGYVVKDVIVDGVSQGNISSYTFMSVQTAHTIEVVYEKGDLTNATISLASAMTTTNEIPELRVQVGNQILTEKDDYTVSCKEVKADSMTLEITGNGNYKGTRTVKAYCNSSQIESDKTNNNTQNNNNQNTTDNTQNNNNQNTNNTTQNNNNQNTNNTTQNNNNQNTNNTTQNNNNQNTNNTTESQNANSTTQNNNNTEQNGIMQGETTAQTGDSYDVGNFVYEITNADKKTVTLTDKIKDKKSVTVPATVKINGVAYKVTAIGASVWEDDNKVKTIVIGKNVQKIGANAFAGAKQLKKITIKATALKTVGNKAFKNISAKAVIKVPGKKKAEYKKLLKGKGQKKTVVIK